MTKLSDSEEGIQELTESQAKGEHRRRSCLLLRLFPAQGGDDVVGRCIGEDRRGMRGTSGGRGGSHNGEGEVRAVEGRGRGDICNV